LRKTPVAVYDACVLYPALPRGLLLRLDRAGICRALTTAKIQDECIRSLLRKRPGMSLESLERILSELNCPKNRLVSGYEDLMPSIDLPDPNDRHVVAAAKYAKADLIVTFNLKDFPPECLAPHKLAAEHPDDFILRLLRSHGKRV